MSLGIGYEVLGILMVEMGGGGITWVPLIHIHTRQGLNLLAFGVRINDVTYLFHFITHKTFFHHLVR